MLTGDKKQAALALAAKHRSSLGRYSKSAKLEAKRQQLGKLVSSVEQGTAARKEIKRLSTAVIAKRKPNPVMNPYTARGKQK